MDALTLLTADHNRVRGCFARFTAAHEANDTTAMSSLVDRLAEELHVHTTIEEEIFYPQVRQGSDDLEEMIAEGIEVSAILDHDDSAWQVARHFHDGVFVRSFYFCDPDGILLEFASWTRPVGRADDVAVLPVDASGAHVEV